MEQQPGFGPSYYAVITGPVLDNKALAANAKLLFASITSMTDRTGYCWASNKYLADRFGWGERTVSRLIAQLTEHGFISYRMILNPNTQKMERRIYVGSDVAIGVAKTGDTRQNWRGGVAKTGEAFNKYEEEKKNNTPISPAQCAELWEMFDRFWEAYPKKKGKENARNAWGKLRPDMSLCRVMSAALKQQCRSEEWTKEKGRYVPYPATWLNGRRWEDEADAPAQPAAPVIPDDDERRGRFL